MKCRLPVGPKIVLKFIFRFAFLQLDLKAGSSLIGQMTSGPMHNFQAFEKSMDEIFRDQKS